MGGELPQAPNAIRSYQPPDTWLDSFLSSTRGRFNHC